MVRALRRAYENACEFHDPAVGSNEQTFGFQLYFFAKHRLEEEANDSNGLLRIASTMPIFRLAAGEYELACHRVGRSAGENIWTSFPKNEGAAASMAMDQYLPGLAPDLRQAKKVVLAHLGNPEDGYGKSYLCIPTREADGKIVEWGYAQELDSSVMAQATEFAATPEHPEEVISEPVLRKKDKASDDRK
jgi:hypothetical protein